MRVTIYKNIFKKAKNDAYTVAIADALRRIKEGVLKRQ